MIEAVNLTKSFQMAGLELTVLKGINLTIAQGEILAIVGASGAGKSTLLHILGTLDRPTSGTVLFEGQDLFQLSDQKRAEFRNRRIGFVFQFHHLLPEFTALENVCLPAYIQNRSAQDAQAEATSLLKDVGLEHRMNHKPGELSGGEQTGNLDTHTGDALFTLMRTLNRSRGITFVIVTHNEKLSAQADRIIHMEDGQIIPL
jgi:lipoprotein-releasing system ATP-binding protein